MGGITMKLPYIVRYIVYYMLLPFVYIWFFLCWLIMKLGRGVYWFGNMLSGFRIDPYNWTGKI